MVILQTRFPEAVDMMFLRRSRSYTRCDSCTCTADNAARAARRFAICRRHGAGMGGARGMGMVVFFVVFAVDYDCPARGEGAVVFHEVVGFEA